MRQHNPHSTYDAKHEFPWYDSGSASRENDAEERHALVRADDEGNLMRDSTRSMVFFGVASLVAVAAGCVAMAQSGVAPSSWLRTVVAWAVGAGLASLLARYGEPRSASTGAVVLATGALMATLFGAGIEGVHRWLDIGPLHINAAALVVPALIVGLAAIRITSPMGLVLAFIAAIVLLAQPDASQLTSFAIAASILVVRASVVSRLFSGVLRGGGGPSASSPLLDDVPASPASRRLASGPPALANHPRKQSGHDTSVARPWKAFALLVAVAFAIAGWRRPDPLDPVAEVEQIFTMCVAVSPFLALLAGLALAAAAVAPLSFSSPAGHAARDGAIALSAYFLSVSIAPFLGWFPVPLVGLGMSFPVGFWLGMGLLPVIGRHPH